MNTLKEKVDYLNAEILKGNILGVFEELYADNVVMQENNEAQRIGKDVNREYEQNFVSAIEEFHGAEVKAVAVNEETGTAMIESHMDVTLKGYGRVARTQVAVQKWENGKIVFERFYYSNN